jgi:hypothetical protein
MNHNLVMPGTSAGYDKLQWRNGDISHVPL